MVHSNSKSDESLSTKKAVRILLSMKETESIFVFTSVKKDFCNNNEMNGGNANEH